MRSIWQFLHSIEFYSKNLADLLSCKRTAMGETLTISTMVLQGVGFETPRLRTQMNAFWAAFSSFGLIATIWEVEGPTKALLLWCFQCFVDKACWGPLPCHRFLWQKMTPILGSLKLMSFKLWNEVVFLAGAQPALFLIKHNSRKETLAQWRSSGVVE